MNVINKNNILKFKCIIAKYWKIVILFCDRLMFFTFMYLVSWRNAMQSAATIVAIMIMIIVATIVIPIATMIVIMIVAIMFTTIA